MTNYAGIDYSMGRSNYDPETGIHYGIAVAHDLAEWIHSEFQPEYGDPHCPRCGNEAVAGESHSEQHPSGGVSVWTEHPEHTEDWECDGCGDYRCEQCEYLFDGDQAFGDECLYSTFDDSEYTARLDNDNDVWLFKSPYYTYAQFCSPCAPGAGYLRNATELSVDDAEQAGFPKTYCFGKEWFDNENCPYPYYRVDTGELAYSPPVSEDAVDA